MKFSAVVVMAGLFSSTAAFSEEFDPVVKIGVLVDFSTTVKDNTGDGSLNAAKMAVDDFLVEHPDSVLKPEIVRMDHQNKVDTGLSMGRSFYDEGGDFIIGVANSAIALGVAQLAKTDNKIIAVTSSGSVDIHGKGCTPNSFHWGFDNYGNVGVVKPLVAGGVDSWYFITVDYTFGHDFQAQATKFIEAGGGKVVGGVTHPLGAQDYSSYVLSAQASGAKGIALANGSTDFSNAFKQAAEFGITKSQTVIGLAVLINDLHALGPKIAGGLTYAQTFYWDANDTTRKWAKRFAERNNGRYPAATHASDYSAVMHYLKTVNEVKSHDGALVVAEMKKRPVVDEPFGETSIRQDGRRLMPMYLLVAKTPEESTFEWDLEKLSEVIPADKAWRPLSEGGCPMVSN